MKNTIWILILVLSFITNSVYGKTKSQENFQKTIVRSYIVTFECNGGTNVATVTVDEGKELLEPIPPTKTSYIFLGWYKDMNFTNKWIFDTEVLKEDTILYAKWDLIKKNEDIFVEKGTIEKSNLIINDSFYIQKYEVTQYQFEELMCYNPSFFKGEKNNPLYNNPVEKVTLYDAITYANKLSEKNGLTPYYKITNQKYSENPKRISSASVVENTSANGYRLPTSKEWEYAARGGIKSNNFSYSGSNIVTEVAWIWDNITLDGESYGSKAVGRKKSNELNIHDMIGNVWEWTSSLSTEDNAKYVFRGGGWGADSLQTSLTFTYSHFPYYYSSDIGFRLVRSDKIFELKS